MKYFFVNLAVHLVISAILIILLIVTTNRNRRNAVKHGIWYFLPVVFSILIVLDLSFCIAPRLLDIKSVLYSTCSEKSGVIEEVSSLNNCVTIDGKYYYVNPKYEYPTSGTRVDITYTPHANCILEMNLSDGSIVSEY